MTSAGMRDRLERGIDCLIRAGSKDFKLNAVGVHDLLNFVQLRFCCGERGIH